MDSKVDEKRAHTLGHQILDQARLLAHEIKTNNEANIAATQKAFVEDPKWAVLMGKREAAVKKLDAVLAGLPPRINSFSLTTRVTILEGMLDYYLTNDIPRGLEKAEGVEKEIHDFFPAYRKSVNEFKAAVAEVAPLVGEKYTQEIVRLDAIIHMLETKERILQGILKQLREKQAEQAQIPPPPTRPLLPPALPLPLPLPATQPKWNEKELLKWRVEWLMGIRNPNRNAARLKQWSAYRQTLTEEERKAQNANLKIKATRKNRVNRAGNRNMKTAKNKKGAGGKPKTFAN